VILGCCEAENPPDERREYEPGSGIELPYPIARPDDDRRESRNGEELRSANSRSSAVLSDELRWPCSSTCCMLAEKVGWMGLADAGRPSGCEASG